METTTNSITPHLAKLKLFKDSSERQVWLVYQENTDTNNQNYMLHMCQEWASLDREAAIEYAAKEKKKRGEFNFHVYQAILYLQNEEIAIKDLVHENAFTDCHAVLVVDPQCPITLNDQEQPRISNILWNLDLVPNKFADIKDLPDSFIVVLVAQLGDKAFKTLMILPRPSCKRRKLHFVMHAWP